ncbi:response regulator transcription factor [Photobacterium sp. GJ3]|uniref:response regulator transcription factor n=1 Tax=Photobacterium sp. GJ3 TaxID=2829502 RepID=UPI001B8CB7AA|nr:response regulator transcription factor [Photobacterium sp. GJ3]QUJ66179.1 response regulator transcription factor [Photobacterium sp. GJ3]
MKSSEFHEKSKNDEKHLVIIEDDIELANLLSVFFEKNGFNVCLKHSGKSGLDYSLKHQPDFVLLDLMLPEVDGISICRALQNRYQGKIIVLTASEDDIDQIMLLEMGADDYIQKPVNPRIILARLRNLIRLSANHRSSQNTEQLKVGQFQLNIPRRSVYKGEESLDLTDSEFQLFSLLARNADNIVTRDDISRQLFGRDFDGLDRSIDNKVMNLRKKIGDELPYKFIITVRGKGYLLVNDEQE